MRPSPTVAVNFDTTDAQIVRPYKGYSSRAPLHFAARQMGYKSLLGRESGNPSVDILDYPARKRKILRNFDLLLPKFHFILPKFYFVPPWRVFVCSLEILDFLSRYRCMSVDIVMKLGSSHIPQSCCQS